MQEEHCFIVSYSYGNAHRIHHLPCGKTEMKGEAKSNIIFMLGVIMMHGGGEAFPTDFPRQIVLQ